MYIIIISPYKYSKAALLRVCQSQMSYTARGSFPVHSSGHSCSGSLTLQNEAAQSFFLVSISSSHLAPLTICPLRREELFLGALWLTLHHDERRPVHFYLTAEKGLFRSSGSLAPKSDLYIPAL